MVEWLSGLESHCIVSLYSSELGIRLEHLLQQWELRKSQHSVVIPPPPAYSITVSPRKSMWNLNPGSAVLQWLITWFEHPGCCLWLYQCKWAFEIRAGLYCPLQHIEMPSFCFDTRRKQRVEIASTQGYKKYPEFYKRHIFKWMFCIICI